jgi:hypothetical protein
MDAVQNGRSSDISHWWKIIFPSPSAPPPTSISLFCQGRYRRKEGRRRERCEGTKKEGKLVPKEGRKEGRLIGIEGRKEVKEDIQGMKEGRLVSKEGRKGNWYQRKAGRKEDWYRR